MFDVFILDMGGHDENVQDLLKRFPHAVKVRYYGTYFDTLKRAVARAKTSFCWVISSCCDYADFDFDYRAAPWEAYQIHCWASSGVQFGDTFLIPVREFRAQVDNLKLIEWYKDINWHSDSVPRLPWPVFEPREDAIEELKKFTFASPYAWMNRALDFHFSLWYDDQKYYYFNKPQSLSLIPRNLRNSIEKNTDEYPRHLREKIDLNDAKPKPLDIIFISNGEPEAEKWYKHLCKNVGYNVKRVKNVDGRAAAYKAAAELSETPWFFAVFAKLEVVEDFDWLWQPPEYLTDHKHYIFHSRNPVNGLEYGHMGVIAYDRRLVLETDEHGLDFTMSKALTVVPVVSAIAHYNTTPELTWRTAFREVLKLRHDYETTENVESEYRLHRWLTVGNGKHGKWSIQGSKDAMEYYELVNGEYDKLMLSFEWNWLKEYYATKHCQLQPE